MSSNAVVAIKLNNGYIISSSINSDGYPEHLGNLLLDDFKNETKISEFIMMGNASFWTSSLDTSVFYIRDRNENKAQNSHWISENYERFVTLPIEHKYLYENNLWYYCTPSSKTLLSEIIKIENLNE